MMPMNRAALLVVVLDFCAIGALPFVFFRRDGRFHLMWWVTALPFFACPALLVGAALGVLPAADPWGLRLGDWADYMAITAAVASIAVIFLTLGTHRIPISLWHQEEDAPEHIVTWGPYRFIRHPFYASFLLAFLSGAILLPHPLVLACGLYALAVLSFTAACEERRLCESSFGGEYRAYMASTGRFFPRVGRRS